jgi:hypothetical protein
MHSGEQEQSMKPNQLPPLTEAQLKELQAICRETRDV